MGQSIKKYFQKIGLINSLIGLIGVIILLLAALVVQFFAHEEPCPLCLLQRAAFVNIGICLLMNLRVGNKVSHWAMAILSACAGIAVSIRQILLHITDPIGFGEPFLGLHMYTWCFMGFALVIVGATVMLLIYPESDN